MNRREFLRLSSACTLMASAPQEVPAQPSGAIGATAGNTSTAWDRGQLLHLLPTVSDREMLIKASFNRSLAVAPLLRVGTRTVPGRMSDTHGECWQFHRI